MLTHLLVVDANTAFATMIKQALEDQGDYGVSVVGSAAEAIDLAARTLFDLAIVDMELPDVSGADAIRGLRAICPTLAVIAIPFQTESADPAFRTLDVQGFLTKPFFLPDLTRIAEEALTRPVGGVAPPPRERTLGTPATPTPTVDRAEGKTDARLSFPSLARASAEPTGEVRLPSHHAPSGAQEERKARASKRAPSWLEDSGLAAHYLAALTLQTAAEAVFLTRGNRLIAYAGQFPKEETDELARILRDSWLKEQDGGQGTLMRFVKITATGSEYLLYAMAMVSDIVLAMAFQTETPVGLIRRQARTLAASLLQLPGETAAPLPAPAAAPLAQRPRAVSASPGTSAAPALPPVETAPLEMAYDWLKSAMNGAAEHTLPALPPEVVVDEGLPIQAETAFHGLARTPHALYNLAYTFVWVPKFPKTRLIGDIAALLDEWIRHNALAHDWRVERVEVRPECVVLVINCPPATAPEKLVTVLKRSASEKVFAEFPSVAADHPGGDFWAPGYLLIGAGQTLTPQQIGDFIAYTRRGQGLNR